MTDAERQKLYRLRQNARMQDARSMKEALDMIAEITKDSTKPVGLKIHALATEWSL